MKINKKNILQSFSDYDSRTQDMLDYTIKQLYAQGKEPNDYALVIIQMLAAQFEIYFKSLDALKDEIVNVCNIGDRIIHAPKPQLDSFQKSSNQITKLLDKLGLSPLESAKIKKLSKVDAEDDAKETYDKILGTI